jgi:rRNA-processing protein FCF1
MDIRLTKVEIWRILDAIIAYKKDYEVSSAVSKTINNLEKKLKKAMKEAE